MGTILRKRGNRYGGVCHERQSIRGRRKHRNDAERIRTERRCYIRIEKTKMGVQTRESYTGKILSHRRAGRVRKSRGFGKRFGTGRTKIGQDRFACRLGKKPLKNKNSSSSSAFFLLMRKKV